MKKLRNIAVTIFQTTFFKRLLLLMAVCLPALLFSGCGQDQTLSINITGLDQDFDLTPCKKADGKPFRIAVLDEAPTIESSYLWLKGIVEQFQEMGYINENLDLTDAPTKFEDFYEFLLASDLGEYVAFDDTYYLLDGTNDEELADIFTGRIAAGKIDLIACTGTTPGLFLKDLDPGVPCLVSFATDPIASGIIPSAEDTGNENLWALVEPNPLGRQLDAYYNLFHFEKLGILASKEWGDIAGVPEYEKEAENLGIEVVKKSFSEAEMGEKHYISKLRNAIRTMQREGIDALLLTYAVMDDSQTGELTDLLAEAGIPYLIGDGDDPVRNGGLICMSCYDYESYGKYIASIMSNIFHGKKAGEIPCTYTSSMRIVLNKTTAKATGEELNFVFLQSVDKVFE